MHFTTFPLVKQHIYSAQNSPKHLNNLLSMPWWGLISVGEVFILFILSVIGTSLGHQDMA